MECWNSFGVWSEDELKEFGRERTQTQQGTSEGHLILINVRINRVLQQRRRIRQIPGTSPVLHLLLSTFLRTKEKAPTDIFKVPHFFFLLPFFILFSLFNFTAHSLRHSRSFFSLACFLSQLFSTCYSIFCLSQSCSHFYLFLWNFHFHFFLIFIYFLYSDILFSCIMRTLIEGGHRYNNF